MIVTIAKGVGIALLFMVVVALLAVAIVPRFLDRIYYRGPASDHFDGERFFNPGVVDDTAQVPGGSGGRGAFLWRQLTGSDGRPEWPKTVPVTPSRPAARVDGDAMVATWIGHATVLVQAGGLNILTDPVWAEQAGPLGLGPRRVARPGVAFADLPKIDLVLLSHNHYDHMDLKTLRRLWDRDRPTIVTGLGNDAILRGAGIGTGERDASQVVGLDWGQRLSGGALCAPGQTCPARIDVTVTRNHHWGSRWFADRNRALWSSFVVRLPGGNLFFAGDTGWGDGSWIDAAAALGPIRLALIPIGAFRFVPGQLTSGSHIGPGEAALIHARLGAARSIPIHWGTFRLSYEGYDTPPKLLALAMRRTGGDGFAAVPIGVPQAIAPIAAPAPRAAPVDRAAMAAWLGGDEARALR